MAELYPRLLQLAELACRYDIGLNIDAEEADRLELSLDLLERLCFEPALAGWNGIGFVIQAYQKRCPAVVDWLIDLARRSGRRLMVRLVKGAYWDSEIKRAQLDGQAGYPVYTRKAYTDVAYLACAKKLLAAPAEIYPQFATHNAHTLAAVHALAGPDYADGQYEFQCLHGMGEPLYEQVVGPRARQARPAVPHLRAGRHPRHAARLPGAPPARERRQHLVRQPHRQRRGAARGAGAEPGAHGRGARRRWKVRSACRIRRSACRATCSAPSGPTRAASISPARPQLRALDRRVRRAGRGALVGRAAARRRRRRRRGPSGPQSGRSPRRRRPVPRCHPGRRGGRAGRGRRSRGRLGGDAARDARRPARRRRRPARGRHPARW